MDDLLRASVTRAVGKFTVQTAKRVARSESYKKPHAVVLITEHTTGEATVALGHKPKEVDVAALTSIARISEEPTWQETRAALLEAKPTADEFASLAAMALHMLRQSGAIDNFRPAFPLELLAIAHGESVNAARKRRKEIEDEIAAGEESEAAGD